MTFTRSAIFHVLVYLWTLVLGVLYLPLLMLPRRFILPAGRFWCRGILCLLSGIVGLRHETQGDENAAGGPALYAFKHQSAWDTLVLCLLIRDPAIILKRELLWIPIFGWYLWKHRMIAIDRGAGATALKRMVATAREEIANGRSLVVFPEGTRTAPGQTVDYQPGIAALYTRLEVPVIPVALNSGVFWRRREFAKRPGCVTVRYLPPIGAGLDRRKFMARLRDEIETASTDLLPDDPAMNNPQPASGAISTVDNSSGTPVNSVEN